LIELAHRANSNNRHQYGAGQIERRRAPSFRGCPAHLCLGLGQGLIEDNPLPGMGGPIPSKARGRVLTGEEIRAFWRAAGEQGWPFENVFKLLLLTAQRREEEDGMHWKEIDLSTNVWTIAKERCKNGKVHAIDLSPEALPLIKSMRNEPGLVFSTTNETPVCGFSKAKKRIDLRMGELLPLLTLVRLWSRVLRREAGDQDQGHKAVPTRRLHRAFHLLRIRREETLQKRIAGEQHGCHSAGWPVHSP
jgi:integrase